MRQQATGFCPPQPFTRIVAEQTGMRPDKRQAALLELADEGRTVQAAQVTLHLLAVAPGLR
ncbi:hypothetical protein [Erwinia sp. Leaf53]|uniref:hypothetical protein n=1 Tax=Erwinia sp. Leaf53 TaxID=1736225 RepID=UPI003519C9E5